MRIVVTGVDGQLGAEIFRQACAQGHEVIPSVRATLDLGRLDRLEAVTAQGWPRPDAIINCAAFTDVDRAETEPEEARRVNAEAPRWLARAAAAWGAAMVQISTDYVFGREADRRQPYDEDDAPGPLNVYGATKLQAEQWVRQECPRHFIVRTCGLYGYVGRSPLPGAVGPSGAGGHDPSQRRNFVRTMLRLADEGKPIRVVQDQVCTPTNVRDVAAVVLKLIEMDRRPLYGIYHVTQTGQCSWWEFAREIFRLAGRPVTVQPISSSEFVRPARRPSYSVLGHRRLKEAGLEVLRPWQEALAEYIRALTAGGS